MPTPIDQGNDRSLGLRKALEFASVYRLWQAPFQREKFKPIWRHNDLSKVARVLDVGCGPAINTPYFSGVDYLGLDINEKYISYARRRTGRRFEAVDVTRWKPEARDRYDFVLVNSFFHHVDDESTRRILGHLPDTIAPGGHVHIVDLIMPPVPGLARSLALWDRGQYPRPVEQWRELFSAAFEPVVFEPFTIRLAGQTLWEMVYFKGAVR